MPDKSQIEAEARRLLAAEYEAFAWNGEARDLIAGRAPKTVEAEMSIRAIIVALSPQPASENYAELIEQLNERAVLIVELLAHSVCPGKNLVVLKRRARRVIDGHPEAIAAGEANYRAYCAADPDHAPEGTLESLATCAHMLEEYGPECCPANESGQVDFVRAMMDATAGDIRAYLANPDGPEAAASIATLEAENARLREMVRLAWYDGWNHREANLGCDCYEVADSPLIDAEHWPHSETCKKLAALGDHQP